MKSFLSETVATVACKLGIFAVAAATCPPAALAVVGMNSKEIFDAVAGVGGSVATSYFGRDSVPRDGVDYFEAVKRQFATEANFDLSANSEVSSDVAEFFNQALLDISFPADSFRQFSDAFGSSAGVYAGIATKILEAVPSASNELSTPQHKTLAENILTAAVGAAIKARNAQFDLIIDMQGASHAKLNQIAASDEAIKDELANVQGNLAIIMAKLDRSGEASLNESQVRILLNIYAQEHLPPDQWFDKLLENIQGDKKLIKQLRKNSNDPQEILVLRRMAAEAIEAKDYDRADHFLKKAESIDLSEEGRRCLSQSQTMFSRAQIYYNTARYRDAADIYMQSYFKTINIDRSVSFDAAYNAANCLDDHGRIFGENSLDEAVLILREKAIPLVQRERNPKEWADSQNLLGIILHAIGDRLDGVKGLQALEDSQVAFRSALAVFTRKEFPIDWAMAQNNLGNLRLGLGERLDGSAGTQALQQAQAAHLSVLEVRTREDFPIDWAATQNNLGIVLAALGDRLDGAAGMFALKQAQIAYRLALEIRTRQDFPIAWAETQNNLASVLHTLVNRLDGVAGVQALEQARDAYYSALEIRTREDFPIDWATTQNNLGTVFTTLGERLDGDAGLKAFREAQAAFESALEIRTRENFPINWAATHVNLGSVLQNLGQRLNGDKGLRILENAQLAYRSALEVYNRTDFPVQWAAAQNNLGNVLRSLGRRLLGKEAEGALRAAHAAFLSTLEIYTREDFPVLWASAQNNLGNVLSTLGRHVNGRAGIDDLKNARPAYYLALEIYTRSNFPAQWATTHENIAVMCNTLFSKTSDKVYLREAIEAVTRALKVYKSIGASYDIGTAERLLKHLHSQNPHDQ